MAGLTANVANGQRYGTGQLALDIEAPLPDVPFFLSGSSRQTLTGGFALVPLKGSSSVMIGSPGRNIRVTEFGTGSVILLNCWKPESGGIRFAVLI